MGLRGYGRGAQLRNPTFAGKHDKFADFINKLDNWLMINGLFHVTKEDEPEQGINLALYCYISICLEGQPFQLICASAKGDGKKAYKILCINTVGTLMPENHWH